MQVTICTANCVGQAGNCSYPNKVTVVTPEQLQEAVKKDHVCAEFKGNYRSIENFIRSDVIVMDIDNDHTEVPAEWITSENGNKALCYYSLGNFVSNQQYTDTVLGGMAYVEIKKEDGQTVIANNSVIPVVTHNDKTGDPVVIQTYYLADYTQELAEVHDTLLSGFNDDFSLNNLQQKAKNVFGNQIRDRIR